MARAMLLPDPRTQESCDGPARVPEFPATSAVQFHETSVDLDMEAHLYMSGNRRYSEGAPLGEHRFGFSICLQHTSRGNDGRTHLVETGFCRDSRMEKISIEACCSAILLGVAWRLNGYPGSHNKTASTRCAPARDLIIGDLADCTESPR